MLLHELAEKNEINFSDETAIIYGDKKFTYKQINELSDRIAFGLLNIGVKRGDCVAILIGNKPETVLCAFACWKIGASILPMNFYYTDAELNYILDDSNATTIIAGDSFLKYNYVKRLPEITANCNRLKYKIGTIPKSSNDIISLPSLMDHELSLKEKEQIQAESLKGDERDIAFIVYTGGTTGRPKGVLVSHRARYQVDRSWAGVLNLQFNDKYLLPIPLFHLLPWHFIIASFICGSSVTLCESVNAKELLSIIETQKITLLAGVPTMFLQLMEVQAAEKKNLSSLRIGITGGAVFPESKFEHVEKELGSFRLLNYYGLTEAGGDITTVRVDDRVELARKSIGRPIPGFDLKIVDSNKKDLPNNTEGEIAVKADWFDGYYNNPEETKKAFSADGWLYTGDLGEINKEGYVIYKGRSKDMYISGGNNIYPAEIEVTLLRNKSVANVVVLPIPDERLGEVGRAYVVPKQGEMLTEDEIKLFCKDKLATIKIPTEVIITDALPLTPVGKVNKKPLEEEIRKEFQ